MLCRTDKLVFILAGLMGLAVLAVLDVIGWDFVIKTYPAILAAIIIGAILCRVTENRRKKTSSP